MKILTVIPLEKGIFKENLTYFSAKEIPLGAVVEVPIRSKKVLGLVVRVEEAAEAKTEIKDMDFNLRKVLDVKENSIFRKEFFESALKCGEYFAAPQNYAVSSLIPSILKEEYDKIAKISAKNLDSQKINSGRNIRSEKLAFQSPYEDRLSFYKTMIRENFAAKKSVWIILPTEHDIEEVAASLSKGIEKFTFFFHSRITPKKTLEKIIGLLECDHGALIVSTAPYLAMPRYDLGAIVLEHESSTVYKMMEKPRFDLRTFVEIFAAKTSTKLIMADNLLRYETIERRNKGELAPLYPLSFKIPESSKIEMFGRDNSGSKKFKVLSEDIMKPAEKALDKKKNIFIFSLRKGLSTMTVCRDCGETVMCENCQAPVVLYLSRDEKKRMFICNRCHTERDPQAVCAYCRSWNLIPLGIGTDTVHEEIKKLFPKAKIFQLDKETAKTARGAEKIIKDFEDSEGAVLIGTEMVLFYLKKEVPITIIASLDSLWSIPNFRMGEKILQLLLGIFNRTKEKMLIQTKNERDSALTAVKRGDILPFIREELEDRKNLDYPPFKRFIKITFMGEREEAQEAKRILANMFGEYKPEIFSGFVAKQKGQYVVNALIKMDLKNWSQPEILPGASIDQNLLGKLLSLPYEFAINVDPEDLL